MADSDAHVAAIEELFRVLKEKFSEEYAKHVIWFEHNMAKGSCGCCSPEEDSSDAYERFWIAWFGEPIPDKAPPVDFKKLKQSDFKS